MNGGADLPDVGVTRREPKDKTRIGLGFIDVLFALVIGRALEPLDTWDNVPNVGRAQLVLAVAMVATSWIGYHSSTNRPAHFVRFNFGSHPLYQFGIDCLLVGIYWMLVISSEGVGNYWANDTTARTEAVLVAMAFALFVAWDFVGYFMRKSDRYENRPLSEDNPRRRMTTGGFAAAFVAAAVIVWLWDPSSTRWILTIDLVLAAGVILFRFAKPKTKFESVD